LSFPSSSLNAFKVAEKIRIKPPDPITTPDKNGVNPAPGLEKFPKFSLIDSMHMPIPRTSQIKPPTMLCFLIFHPLLKPILFIGPLHAWNSLFPPPQKFISRELCHQCYHYQLSEALIKGYRLPRIDTTT
jgi:hypothetical protein